MAKSIVSSTRGCLVLITLLLVWPGTQALAQPSNAPFQLRVTGTCAPGSSIRAINLDGSVVCETDDAGVTNVTASPPLEATGTTTRNIALPNVVIGPDNTAIGTDALGTNTTGFANTATGAAALGSNTTGSLNTASGWRALFSNTASFNTSSGAFALGSNTTGERNTASGLAALGQNTTGDHNTASGSGALQLNTTGSSNTASGYVALAGNTTGDNNTAYGVEALQNSTTGDGNTASGFRALFGNTTGSSNTASGLNALFSNITGSNNTAVGAGANVSASNLANATAIGAGAVVNASNKIRLGNAAVTVIEGQVDFTFTSDQTRKENFQPVDGEDVLRKLRGLSVTSWNYIGHDPKAFRHYGPMGQAFFAAFGHDGIGTIGSPTTLTSSDVAGILMSAVQAMEKRTVELQQSTESLKESVEALKAENAQLKARLERSSAPSVAALQ